MLSTINRNSLTHGLDLPNQSGIEIGPLVNPVVRRTGSNIKYVDRASTAELREWYSRDPAINIDDIMEIDYIWGDHTLSQATGGTNQFDYCIASHVIEHVPDLITWLGEIASILKVGGVACFAVPDKRYTFDYLRSLTEAADLVDNYLNKRRKPSFRHIYDHFSNHAELDITQAWQEGFDGKLLKPGKSARQTYLACLDALENDKYVDSHCSVFTEQSFFDLMSTISELGLLDFRVKKYFPVKHGMFEFFVQLEKLDDRLNEDEKSRQFNQSIDSIHNTYLEMSFSSSVNCLPKLYFDSGHGFNEPETVEQLYSLASQDKTLRFFLPMVPDLKLRFDPMDCEGDFSIRDVKFCFAGDSVTLPPNSFEIINDVENLQIHAQQLLASVSPGGSDPAFLINLPS